MPKTTETLTARNTADLAVLERLTKAQWIEIFNALPVDGETYRVLERPAGDSRVCLKRTLQPREPGEEQGKKSGNVIYTKKNHVRVAIVRRHCRSDFRPAAASVIRQIDLRRRRHHNDFKPQIPDRL